MKLFTKEELITEIHGIFEQGWCPSVKKTISYKNDGAVGNTLESLLGIKENNLPIPNAREWELKGKRVNRNSLITLKHIDPSPRGARIVPNLLLPNYGWTHKQAGKRYPEGEMSFRSTTSATSYTSRGFKIEVDRQQKKVKFVFDAGKVDTKEPEIANWLKSVENRIGLGPFNPEPYWGFEDLRYALGVKMKNCFYVLADSKVDNGHEYFHYKQLYQLSGFSFENLLNELQSGGVLIDFDARTGHNHGTKIRVRPEKFFSLYETTKEV